MVGQHENKVRRFDNLTIVHVDADSEAALATCAQRAMQLQAMIQDGQVWLGTTEQSEEIIAFTVVPLTRNPTTADAIATHRDGTNAAAS